MAHALSRVVVVTGAGLSAESGIPTFRGPEGYWTVGSRNFHAMELATLRAFREMPEEVWGCYLYRRTVCRASQPNEGHLALLELERSLGDDFLLVTQNVDGLHRRCGSAPYEIHGNIDYLRCSEGCSSTLTPIGDRVGAFARNQTPTAEEMARLRCPACGALARPHVLWFDECYDEELFRFESSRRAAALCSTLITVGSSGSTNLPMQMAELAAARGAKLIDVNPEPNPFGSLAQSSGGIWLQSSATVGMRHILGMFEGRGAQ